MKNQGETWWQKEQKGIKKKAAVAMALSLIVLLTGLSVCLTAGCFFVEQAEQAREYRSRTEPFDAWEGPDRVQDSYKTLEADGMTECFASDFKDTYFYYLVTTEDGMRIVRGRGETPPEEWLGLMDYFYGDWEDGAPEPLTLRGIARPVDEDVLSYAVDMVNYAVGEEFLTEDMAEDVFGSMYLDTAGKPGGGPGTRLAWQLAGAGVLIVIVGGAGLFWNWRQWRRAEAALTMDMSGYDGEVFENGDPGAGDPQAAGASSFPAGYETGGAGRKAKIRQALQRGEEKDLEQEQQGEGRVPESSVGNDGVGASASAAPADSAAAAPANSAHAAPASRRPRMLPGLLGAFGGSLAGVAVWVFLGQIGFIAGLAGFVMLTCALDGYRRLAGGLDRRGAYLCVAVTAVMLTAANGLDYLITLCWAYFQWECSLDTVRYVVTHYFTLMGENGLWGGFVENLLVGFLLAAWSSRLLLKAILFGA